MPMEIKIAELPEIGARLQKAMTDQGMTPYEMAKRLGVGHTTFYRWVSGENEGGCRQIGLAGAMLGLQPNDLLLFDATRVDAPDVDESELFALKQIWQHCVQIWRMTGGKRKPAAAVEAMLREVIIPYEEIESDKKIPKDAKVRIEGPGILTIEPAKKRQAGSAGEDPAKYGSRKGKRSKK